ncbi:hypothetical protein L5014_11320, partial [Paraburkholderia sp. RG36]|nr:hypothetical protein [Paraburkholderia tagetis]
MKGAEWAVLATVGIIASIGLTGVAVAQQSRPVAANVPGGAPQGGNPLEALPQINAPKKAPNV